MKKLFTLLFVVGLFTLAACGEKSTEQAADSVAVDTIATDSLAADSVSTDSVAK